MYDQLGYQLFLTVATYSPYLNSGLLSPISSSCCGVYISSICSLVYPSHFLLCLVYSHSRMIAQTIPAPAIANDVPNPVGYEGLSVLRNTQDPMKPPELPMVTRNATPLTRFSAPARLFRHQVLHAGMTRGLVRSYAIERTSRDWEVYWDTPPCKQS